MAMKIAIIGGSNSVKSTGWVGAFAEVIGDLGEVLNRSVGAAPSIMGYFRAVTESSLGKGDVVIWEYAVNDERFIVRDKQTPELLLGYCEMTLRYCQKRNIRFIPLIFTAKTMAWEPKSPYRASLHRLFEHYGLLYLDVTEEVPAKLDRDRMPAYLYQDELHYKSMPFITRFIAKRARAMMAHYQRPKLVAPLFATAGTKVEIFTGFDDSEQATFTNSVLTVETFAPDPGTGTMLARIPGPAFRLVALILLCPVYGGALRISAPDRSFAVSATFQNQGFLKPMLKLCNLTDDKTHSFAFAGATTFSISRERSNKDLIYDLGFVARPTEKSLDTGTATMVAMIIERRA